jgi:hypothetical protein
MRARSSARASGERYSGGGKGLFARGSAALALRRRAAIGAPINASNTTVPATHRLDRDR